MEINNHTLRYLIHFLIGEDLSDNIISSIGYTNDCKQFDLYKIVIIPSTFFNPAVYGTMASLPNLPLQRIEGIPFLFGSPRIEKKRNTWIIHADIIASTYFLITRYEEITQRNIRDVHGRFPGRKSVLYRSGILSRPIVDEYRILLRKYLTKNNIQIPPTQREIHRIFLTHDLDSPTLYHTWKGLIRSILDKRGIIPSIKGKLGPIENDPYYTFPWLFKQNERLQQQMGNNICKQILFVRSSGNKKQDKPHYNLQSKDIKQLLQLAMQQNIHIGLHSSYAAGINPTLIQKEKIKLETSLGKSISFNRHHFLSTREPEDMDYLEQSGITEDFTMGYADVAGFRLGTSYPVHWINPINCRLSSLILHPLTIMDSSLNEEKYMHLNYTEALFHCKNLIQQVKNVGGELTLLWHNTSVQNLERNYQRKLYCNLLNELTLQ